MLSIRFGAVYQLKEIYTPNLGEGFVDCLSRRAKEKAAIAFSHKTQSYVVLTGSEEAVYDQQAGQISAKELSGLNMLNQSLADLLERAKRFQTTISSGFASPVDSERLAHVQQEIQAFDAHFAATATPAQQAFQKVIDAVIDPNNTFKLVRGKSGALEPEVGQGADEARRFQYIMSSLP